jgi:hypothetical protein
LITAATVVSGATRRAGSTSALASRSAIAYHSTKRAKTDRERHLGALEIVCIVLCVAAVIALIVWIIANAGGGALMT